MFYLLKCFRAFQEALLIQIPSWVLGVTAVLLGVYTMFRLCGRNNDNGQITSLNILPITPDNTDQATHAAPSNGSNRSSSVSSTGSDSDELLGAVGGIGPSVTTQDYVDRNITEPEKPPKNMPTSPPTPLTTLIVNNETELPTTTPKRKKNGLDAKDRFLAKVQSIKDKIKKKEDKNKQPEKIDGVESLSLEGVNGVSNPNYRPDISNKLTTTPEASTSETPDHKTDTENAAANIPAPPPTHTSTTQDASTSPLLDTKRGAINKIYQSSTLPNTPTTNPTTRENDRRVRIVKSEPRTTSEFETVLYNRRKENVFLNVPYNLEALLDDSDDDMVLFENMPTVHKSTTNPFVTKQHLTNRFFNNDIEMTPISISMQERPLITPPPTRRHSVPAGDILGAVSEEIPEPGEKQISRNVSAKDAVTSTKRDTLPRIVKTTVKYYD
jgi:hypothetical protein